MDEKAITLSFPGGLRVDANYKGFVIHTDQPVYEGGTNTAPAPFDLFLASLATCSGYYVLAFCVERKIPMEGLAVVMKREKDPETHMIAKVRIEITLPQAFPEKYKDAVVRAVDQCAVRRHLVKPPAIEIAAEIKR